MDESLWHMFVDREVDDIPTLPSCRSEIQDNFMFHVVIWRLLHVLSHIWIVFADAFNYPLNHTQITTFKP